MEGMQGKVALVTGAASGIGQATALAFARAGVRVVLADVNPACSEGTLHQVRAGGEGIFVPTDVAQPAQVEALVQAAIDAYGRLDYAVNNAGIEGAMAPTAECTEENWDRVIAINLKGLWLCLRAEIPRLLVNGGGAIVNVASVAGLVGFGGLPAYCASKGGVVQLTRAAALEYATMQVRVNAVCPGAIQTPMIERIEACQVGMDEALVKMHPLGRIGTPEEVAAAIVWLCSPAASFITGAILPVDGGFVAQ